MRPTDIQERMDLMAEVADVKHDAIRTWSNTWSAEGERLNGVPLRLRWMEDGTAWVEVDGVPAVRVSVEITVHPVEFENAPTEENKPSGFIVTKTWGTVPAGWFVQDPKGAWWEVLASAAIPAGQRVAMRNGSNRGEWTRDPRGEVKCRRGTATIEKSDALDALGSAFETRIINDGEGPMQS